MKHIRSVSTVPAVAEIDIPALVKISSDVVALLSVGIPAAKLIGNLSSPVSS